MLGDQQIIRQSKIIITRLVKSDGWLASCGGKTGACASWKLYSGRKRKPGSTSKIDANLVAEMLKRNYLQTDPSGCLRPTNAGLVLIDADNGNNNMKQIRSRRIITDASGLTVSVISNDTESPLGWLAARKDKSGRPMISPEQFAAGERIRRDFEFGHLQPSITSSWDGAAGTPRGRRFGGGGSSGMELTEKAMAARMRFSKAVDVLGTELASIVIEVCCMASGLEAAERCLGWPRRSGKLVLQIALSRLAEHYGLLQPDKAPLRHANITSWGADGYRPQIPPVE